MPDLKYTGDIDDYERIAITAAAVGGVAAAKIQGAGKSQPRSILFVLESGQVRWTAHGSDPTSTLGAIINPEGTLTLDGASATRARFYAVSNAVLHAYIGR